MTTRLPYWPKLVERLCPTRASYFLGSRLLGVSSFTTPNCLPHSEAFFCATCGDLWGRVLVDGSAWSVHTIPCEKHAPTGVPDWGAVPGSFLPNRLFAETVSVMFWATVLEHLPPAVLARELEIAIRHFERRNQQS